MIIAVEKLVDVVNDEWEPICITSIGVNTVGDFSYLVAEEGYRVVRYDVTPEEEELARKKFLENEALYHGPNQDILQ